MSTDSQPLAGGQPRRDPAGILLPSQVGFAGDPAETAATAAAFGEDGAGLAIIYLPPPHGPAVLEPLAQVLGELTRDGRVCPGVRQTSQATS